LFLRKMKNAHDISAVSACGMLLSQPHFLGPVSESVSICFKTSQKFMSLELWEIRPQISNHSFSISLRMVQDTTFDRRNSHQQHPSGTAKAVDAVDG